MSHHKQPPGKKDARVATTDFSAAIRRALLAAGWQMIFSDTSTLWSKDRLQALSETEAVVAEFEHEKCERGASN